MYHDMIRELGPEGAFVALFLVIVLVALPLANALINRKK